MINFAIYLAIVCMLGFIYLTVQSALQKRTLPQQDELTTQLAGVSSVETIEQQPRYRPIVNNSHWHRHTFERPRRKVKR